MTLDSDVKKYIKTSRKEVDLLFQLVSEGVKKPANRDPWPNPSSRILWFKGFKDYGEAFAKREAELRVKSLWGCSGSS